MHPIYPIRGGVLYKKGLLEVLKVSFYKARVDYYSSSDSIAIRNLLRFSF